MVLFFLASLSSTEGKAKKKRKQRVFALVPLPPEVPYEVISSLYGLLSSAGASLQLGPKWWWFLDCTTLRLTFKDLVLLEDLADYFSPYFSFKDESLLANNQGGRTSRTYTSSPSQLAFILWCHWYEGDIDFLPYNFEYYFSVHTLTFWAMRSGRWVGLP